MAELKKMARIPRMKSSNSCTGGTYRNRMRLLVLMLTVLLYVQEGVSIRCYECGDFPRNRTTNPLCEGEDDLGRDAGQTCQTDKGYSVCIKIEDPAGKKSMRTCKRDVELAKMGDVAAKLGKNECKTTVYDLYQNNSAIPVFFCTCDEDDCNSGLRETANVFILAITAILCVSFFNP